MVKQALERTQGGHVENGIETRVCIVLHSSKHGTRPLGADLLVDC